MPRAGPGPGRAGPLARFGVDVSESAELPPRRPVPSPHALSQQAAPSPLDPSISPKKKSPLASTSSSVVSFPSPPPRRSGPSSSTRWSSSSLAAIEVAGSKVVLAEASSFPRPDLKTAGSTSRGPPRAAVGHLLPHLPLPGFTRTAGRTPAGL